MEIYTETTNKAVSDLELNDVLEIGENLMRVQEIKVINIAQRLLILVPIDHASDNTKTVEVKLVIPKTMTIAVQK